jgi:membrane protease subunit HflK
MIDAQERAVVMRFGQYQKTILPGLSWQPWLIDTVRIEQVTSERQYSSRGLMLTRDENIVEVPLTVQYNIKSVEDFVLKVNDPVGALQQATDSAIRHVVGSSTLDDVLSEGREDLRVAVRQRLQNYMDQYESGINIIDVTLQRGAPPEQVTAAFDDVNAAEADRDRLIDEAEAYRNGVLPEARGRAQRQIEEAQAYLGQLVSRATGDASRFSQLLVEYTAAPEVTRQRLYLDAMQNVLGNSSKVMVDTQGGNNLLYLPLDRMIPSANSGGAGQQINQDNLREALNRMQQNSTTTTNRSLR